MKKDYFIYYLYMSSIEIKSDDKNVSIKLTNKDMQKIIKAVKAEINQYQKLEEELKEEKRVEKLKLKFEKKYNDNKIDFLNEILEDIIQYDDSVKDIEENMNKGIDYDDDLSILYHIKQEDYIKLINKYIQIKSIRFSDDDFLG